MGGGEGKGRREVCQWARGQEGLGRMAAVTAECAQSTQAKVEGAGQAGNKLLTDMGRELGAKEP